MQRIIHERKLQKQLTSRARVAGGGRKKVSFELKMIFGRIYFMRSRCSN